MRSKLNSRLSCSIVSACVSVLSETSCSVQIARNVSAITLRQRKQRPRDELKRSGPVRGQLAEKLPRFPAGGAGDVTALRRQIQWATASVELVEILSKLSCTTASTTSIGSLVRATVSRRTSVSPGLERLADARELRGGTQAGASGGSGPTGGALDTAGSRGTWLAILASVGSAHCFA
jgi:hypothetical protein